VERRRGLVTKHAIKHVDRLLGNQNIDVWDSFACWVPHLIGAWKQIVVAMEWTDFDRDGQATLALNLATYAYQCFSGLPRSERVSLRSEAIWWASSS
jgi:hypothetical protein